LVFSTALLRLILQAVPECLAAEIITFVTERQLKLGMDTMNHIAIKWKSALMTTATSTVFLKVFAATAFLPVYQAVHSVLPIASTHQSNSTLAIRVARAFR
jgi:hypothetical protein